MLAGPGCVDACPVGQSNTLRDVAGVGRIGFEALAQWGGMRMQAEHVLASAMDRDGWPTRTFQAAYVEAAWVLNGDGPKRPYDIVPPHGSELRGPGWRQGAEQPASLHGGVGVFELRAPCQRS